MSIERDIADLLNGLEVDDEFQIGAVADEILREIGTSPEFTQWAIEVAARESVADRVRRHLSVMRTGLTRAQRRRIRVSSLHEATDAAHEVRRNGGTAEEARSVFDKVAYCVDERHGTWKPLRLMTHTDLTYVATQRETMGNKMLMEAAFLRVLAKRVTKDLTVEDVYTEEEIVRIRTNIGVGNADVA